MASRGECTSPCRSRGGLLWEKGEAPSAACRHHQDGIEQARALPGCMLEDIPEPAPAGLTLTLPAMGPRW